RPRRRAERLREFRGLRRADGEGRSIVRAPAILRERLQDDGGIWAKAAVLCRSRSPALGARRARRYQRHVAARAIRILGIDPGLRRTGWGIIEIEGNRLSFLA